MALLRNRMKSKENKYLIHNHEVGGSSPPLATEKRSQVITRLLFLFNPKIKISPVFVKQKANKSRHCFCTVTSVRNNYLWAIFVQNDIDR
jgi:hypothetical protein